MKLASFTGGGAAACLLSATASLFAASPALAADVRDLGVVGTQSAADSTPAESKAAIVAPTKASLDAMQPASSISRDYIENSTSPVSDYAAIAAIAPSVTLGISTNGPGLGETKNSIRGFKDGEFSITYDGIPFGDTNGPTHHSTAYFPASVIGEVVVERGPGKASDLGQATFGGSMNLFSREVANEAKIAPFFSFGTWNTQLLGLRYDSGVQPALGDAKFAVSYQKNSSDGYQTLSAVAGENATLKVQKPIGENTLVTANINWNRNWYRTSDVVRGLTAAQAATLGKNYLLSDNPSLANYYGYNQADKSTVMNYLRVQSNFSSGWGLDNTLYYYNYTNTTRSSAASDVQAGLGTVVTNTAGTTKASQMPGYYKLNEYFVYGDTFKLTRQTRAGTVRIGLWLEKATTHRSLYDVNLLDGTLNYDQRAITGLFGGLINNVAYEQGSGWKMYTPFAEFEWTVTPSLTVTPGLKYSHTTLTMDALVNQGARITQNFSKDFTATLPYLAANYRITPTWSAYAQYAKGMVVPNIGSFQSTGALATNLDPQTSTNYQLGVVHKSGALTFDADVYQVDFNNKIATVPGTSGSTAVFFNQGGVTYKGAETEFTYAFDSGFAAYVNASLNRATTHSNGLAIAGVPDYTGAIGLLYRTSAWSVSLTDKQVGSTWALDNAAYKMDPYSSLDLNIGYTVQARGFGFKSLKATLGVFNLADHQDILSVSARNSTVGTAAYGTVNVGDTFTFQPERSVMLSLRADF